MGHQSSLFSFQVMRFMHLQKLAERARLEHGRRGRDPYAFFTALIARKRSADGVGLEVPGHERLDFRYGPALSDAVQ
ncbi:hypothetical protein, partial [Neorhizobium petrolearium]|uniref:hypothetical protein n=1 Tax=Neorhizobium petrolearium TaxID=515361 RepID=UPI001AE2F11B